MSRSSFLELFDLIRRSLAPTRLEREELNEYYSEVYGDLRVRTVTINPPPLTPEQVEDAVRVFDEPPNPAVWSNELEWAYSNDTTSWFLPRAPDVVTPHRVRWSEPYNMEAWIPIGGEYRDSFIAESPTPDDLAATTVETLVPDTAAEPTPPRRKQTYAEWHAEATTLLAEQEAKHE